MLADQQTRSAHLEPLEKAITDRCLSGEEWTHARAWIAYRQGQYARAVELLQPLVRPRHHTLPRWSIVHDDLGDAYAKLGRTADAQAQWRIALATDYDPGDTGWLRTETERKLMEAADRYAPPLLPLRRYHDAVAILDVASVARTDAGVRYTKLVLLQSDERGAAYGRDTYEAACDAPRSRVLAVHSFNTSGEQVRRIEEPSSWLPDRPGEPWLPTERQLVCALGKSGNLAPRQLSDVGLLRAYRSGSKPIP